MDNNTRDLSAQAFKFKVHIVKIVTGAIILTFGVMSIIAVSHLFTGAKDNTQVSLEQLHDEQIRTELALRQAIENQKTAQLALDKATQDTSEMRAKREATEQSINAAINPDGVK